MVPPAGLEPAAPRLGIWSSIHLSYGGDNEINTKIWIKSKAFLFKCMKIKKITIKKLSTMKSIPYQTLIRHWLAEGIKQELDSVLK